MIDLITSILSIFTWTVVCATILFLFEIARFYQEKSGRKSYYLLFLIPTGLFAAAAVIYSYWPSMIAGIFWADLMRFVAGLVLIGVSYFLLNLMLGK